MRLAICVAGPSSSEIVVAVPGISVTKPAVWQVLISDVRQELQGVVLKKEWNLKLFEFLKEGDFSAGHGTQIVHGSSHPVECVEANQRRLRRGVHHLVKVLQEEIRHAVEAYVTAGCAIRRKKSSEIGK